MGTVVSRKHGSLREEDRVYTSADVDTKLEELKKQELANRDAVIKARLELFEQNVVDAKIQEAKNEIAETVEVRHSGIHYIRDIESAEFLDFIDNPKHGDMYVVEGTIPCEGYVWTQPTDDDEGHWAKIVLGVDTSNFYSKAEACAKAELATVANTANSASSKVGTLLAKLTAIKELPTLTDEECLGNKTNILLRTIIESLTEFLDTSK